MVKLIDESSIDSVTENRTHNAVHGITAVDSTPVSHDAKGLTEDDEGGEFAWDFDNRLSAADASSAGGAASASYTYDAIGRRVSKSDGTDAIVFVSTGRMGQSHIATRLGTPVSAKSGTRRSGARRLGRCGRDAYGWPRRLGGMCGAR